MKNRRINDELTSFGQLGLNATAQLALILLGPVMLVLTGIWLGHRFSTIISFPGGLLDYLPAVLTLLVGFVAAYTLGKLASYRQAHVNFVAVFQACPIPMMLVRQNVIESVNQELSRRYGYLPADIPTLDEWWPQVYPDSEYRARVQFAWKSRLPQIRPDGTGFEPFEVNLRCKSGETRRAMVTTNPLAPLGSETYLITLYDLTEHLQTLDALAESRTVLQSIIETIPMRVFWKDRDLHYLGCNTAFARDAGLETPEDMLDRDDFDLSWRKEAELYRADDREVMETGRAKLGYEEVQTDDKGNLKWLRTSKLPLRDAHGEIVGVLGVYEDVTSRRETEVELRRRESYQRALLDNIPYMIWLKDINSRFLAVNQAFAQAFGWASPDLLVGKSDLDISSKELARHYRADDLRVMHTLVKDSFEEEIEDHRLGRRWIETFKAPVLDDNGELLGTVGFARDITQRKAAEVDLRISATAFEAQEGIVITDAETIILKINPAFTRITGYTADEAIGRKMRLLRSGLHDKAFYEEMWRSIETAGSWQGEIWNKRKCGEIYPEWLTITAIKNEGGTVTNYVGTMIDITARKALEEQVRHMAHYDALTDLPNRVLLTDRLRLSIAQARRESNLLALMYLDLDKFKPVNDTLGHDAGDMLLQQVAQRLQECVRREDDTVARLGGDEFVVLLPHIERKEDAMAIAGLMLDALNQPFEIQGHEVMISSSIGIAIYPEHGEDMLHIMRHADSAMYQAKSAGRSCIRFYNPDAPADMR